MLGGIISLIISAVVAAISALLSLFPSFSIPTQGAADVGQLAGTLNQFLPMTSIAGAALAVLGVKVAVYVWNLIVFVYHQFWGSD